MGFWNPFSDKEEREEAVTCKANGDSYFHGGNYQEAIKYYRRAIQLEPKYADAHYALGFVHYRLKQYDDARRAIRKAVSYEPGERRYHYRLGRLYMKTEAFTDAVRSFKTASKIDPADHESLYFAAMAYKELGSVDWASTYLQRALEIVPNNVGYKKALEELPPPPPEPDLVVTVTPPPPPVETQQEPQPEPEPDALELQREKAWESILNGDKCYDEGNFARALAYYTDALTDDPTLALAYCCQAKVYVRTGDISKARLHADMAYRIDPRDSGLLIEIASVYLMMEDYWKALELLREAAQAAPDSAAAVNAMGAVYINLGDPQQAVGYFRKALELEPGNEVVKQNLEEALQISREQRL